MQTHTSRTLKIKPIKTRAEYQYALGMITKYFDAKPNTDEGEILELVSILVEKYEEEHFVIEAPHPIEAIKFRMEQWGFTRSDLAVLLGGKNRVSEILSKRRGLSIRMIRILHKEWKIPASSLIGEIVD